MKNIAISAIVTTYNEDDLLDRCLSRLSFCDELVVVDLGSEDKSVEIAKKYATKVIETERIPYVEKVIAKFASTLKNDWILHIDPDEVLDEGLINEIKKETYNNSTAIIRIPWIFYYKGKKLSTTIWGREKYKRVLYNKERVKFKPIVHEGAEIISGEESIIKSKYALHHYWMNSYDQLLEKHKRYIKAEGKRRFKNGEQYSFIKKIYESFKALFLNLIYYKGFFGGVRGIFLSFFYSWYVWESNNSLKHYEKQHRK
ncbi:MAG: glycosyltransferase family 2 protein [Candidatus Paceibacterota bacterium]